MDVAEMLAWDGYGPGQDYTINTDHPFRVRVEFNSDHMGNFIGYSTKLS